MLAVAGLLAVEARAQRPALRVYSIPDGLRFSQVFSVLQDGRGFVWTGTSYGLARYDGTGFATLTKAQGLPHDSVYALAEDGERTVWAATQEGLARIAPSSGPRGEPQVLPVPAELARIRSSPAALLRSTEGALWILASTGLFRWHAGTLRPWPLPAGVAAGQLEVLGPVTAHGAFVASGRRVLALDEGRSARTWDVPASMGKVVAVDWLDGEVAVLTESGFGRLGAGRVEPDARRPLPPGLDLDGFVAAGGAICVWSRSKGMVLFEPGGRTRTLGVESGLPSGAVNQAILDRDGILWAATEDGLVKLFDRDVLSFPSRRPGLGPLVLSFAAEADGSTWVGHSEGLSRLSADLTTLAPLPAVPDSLAVWGVLALGGGRVLAATRKGLLLVTRDGKARSFPDLPLGGTGRTYALHRAADGRIWLSAQTGVARFAWDDARDVPVGVEAYTRVGSEPLGEARGITSSPDGTVTIGTDGSGLVRWEEGRLSRIGTAEGLRTGVCRSLLSRGGAVWVGTDSGLLAVEGSRPRALGEVTRALDDPYVVALAGAPGGAAWLATPYRVVEVVDGRVVHALDQARGLVGASTTAENGLLVDGQGRVFVGMVGGFTVFDPRRTGTRSPSPRIAVSWAVDGRGEPVRDGAVIAHRANSVTFGFSSRTYVAEERTRFTERLRGFDAAWSAPHPGAGQRYTNLPAGDYVLEVRAVGAAGTPGDETAALAFSVAPPWWGTVPARAAGLAALAGATWLVAVLRTRRLAARARTLEARIAARTRALRDANARLEEAQRRIEGLLAAPPRAQEDLGGWAVTAAHEVAEAIGATGIEVYRVEGDEARPLSRAGRPPIPAEALRGVREEGERRHGELVVPVRGAAGELLGAFAVLDPPGLLGEPERRLVAGFAHQLGGALEMQRMRSRIAENEAARAELTRDLERKGVLTVRICASCGTCADSKTQLCPRDGSALPPARLLPFRVRDRYRLERVLGEGGMGTVFLAHDERLGREVALKVIRPERFDEPSIRLRFEREASLVARIAHPGVIAVFDSGELDDGSVFLIMERLRGSDLATVVARRGRGTPAEVGSLVVQAAAALAAAHRAGVVHRDVKPENLFLTASASGFAVKVLDFGLAKPLGGAAGPTRTGIVVGTPAYMAPEQVQGKPVTPRADLYSLAAASWEALTGLRLVSADGVGAVFSQILQGTPDPPSRYRPGLPPGVDACFAAALAREPEERPADLEWWAQELCTWLAAVPATEPGWAGPLEVIERPRGAEHGTVPLGNGPTGGRGHVE